MMSEEPAIKVGLIQGYETIKGRFNGAFIIGGFGTISGGFSVQAKNGSIILRSDSGKEIESKKELKCLPLEESNFSLFDVKIGINFHWERKNEQKFQGELHFILANDEKLIAVNIILLEDYLSSVISSEMSDEAPFEFLKAHAVASRSWLIAALNLAKGHKEKDCNVSGSLTQKEDEHIIWYGREEHELFDVCADDHCQRYHGIAGIIYGNALNAVSETRGVFLVYNGNVCDARYHKACGGITENYNTAWEEKRIPYLQSISDSAVSYEPVRRELDAKRWILSEPNVYCNTKDQNILRRILPAFDQETTDFFRWKVVYTRKELSDIIRKKSGIDFGDILNLIPVEFGPSGRMIKIKVEGSRKSLIIGKELEIRRILSHSHLLSSAFVVSAERNKDGIPLSFTLHGAGWGHGVGLCQIGAAVMAGEGFSYDDILKHYFRGAVLKKLY